MFIQLVINGASAARITMMTTMTEQTTATLSARRRWSAIWVGDLPATGSASSGCFWVSVVSSLVLTAMPHLLDYCQATVDRAVGLMSLRRGNDPVSKATSDGDLPSKARRHRLPSAGQR